MEPIREAEMQTQPGKRLNEESKKSGKGPLLIAGIVAICTRNGGKGGYVSTAFYVLAGLIGLLCAGSYSDLNIWSVVSLIFGGICAIATRKQK